LSTAGSLRLPFPREPLCLGHLFARHAFGSAASRSSCGIAALIHCDASVRQKCVDSLTFTPEDRQTVGGNTFAA